MAAFQELKYHRGRGTGERAPRLYETQYSYTTLKASEEIEEIFHPSSIVAAIANSRRPYASPLLAILQRVTETFQNHMFDMLPSVSK